MKMEICLRGPRTFDNVYIVEGLTCSLLSRPVLKDLGLISQVIPNVTVNTIEKTQLIVTEHGQALYKPIHEFPELFNNQFSIMKDRAYHIDLEADAIPISIGACRTIPEPYMPALKKELDDLVAQDNIKKIDYPTPWLHPIVVVLKNALLTSDCTWS
jgi:hypothetical protein